MVDSAEAAGGGLVDCTVGSIVWVRRRNGSWWPGKILAPDDLSTSLITSPHTGTPVKLLGREDAIVDWYNLEKSKRVKSFRCGDFDKCIEKAEAQGMPPKKREKYARREDAILHALELERQMLDKYGKFGYPSNGRYKKPTDTITSGEHLEQGGGNRNSPRSDQFSDSERLAEKSVKDVLGCVEMGLEESPASGDDDSGALPRMRSLQDFGLSTVPPPREEPSGLASRSKRSRYAYPQCGSGDSLQENRVQPSRLQTTVSDLDCLTWNSKPDMREYWEDLLEVGDNTVCASRQLTGSRIMLVDVDLKVKANTYRRDVPMVSLTSKLNGGHPIIGHPLQIEALESGSTDKLLKAAGYFSTESSESLTALRPVWRTGRRTAKSRVPRPRIVDENKKLGFSRNSVKKTCLSSKQKIRTLSSIPLEQKHHNNLASGAINSQVDGLMKTVPTAVACIPVKLVFSRLHEKLIGRHQ